MRKPSLLTGLLFDAAGERLSPSHAVKSGKRYRYYISRSLIAEAGSDHGQGWRLPAHDIEQAVIGALIRTLSNDAFLIGQIGLRNPSTDQVREILAGAKRISARLDKGSAARPKTPRTR